MTLTTTNTSVLRDESLWTPAVHSNVLNTVAIRKACAEQIEYWNQRSLLASWGPATPPIQGCQLPPVTEDTYETLDWRDKYNATK